MNDQTPTPELIAALNTTDNWRERVLICGLLAARGDPAAIPELKRAELEADNSVVRAAAEALHRIDTAVKKRQYADFCSRQTRAYCKPIEGETP